jgi:hypothetical protein
MALLSFADSTPRAYRLKVGNASFPNSTVVKAIPDELRAVFNIETDGSVTVQKNLSIAQGSDIIFA